MSLGPNKKTRIFLSLLLVFLIVFALNKLQINYFRNAVFSISSPFQKAFFKIGEKTSSAVEAIFGLENLKKENEGLKNLNSIFLEKIENLKDVAKENWLLREIIGAKKNEDFEMAVVRTISKDVNFDSIFVDGGERDGIKKGMTVVTSDRTLVGKIGEVFGDFSEVLLISNKKVIFDVEISPKEIFVSTSSDFINLKESDILGIAKGGEGLKVNLEFLLRVSLVKEGDFVFTSQLGGNFPKGLLVGEVKNIHKSDTDAFQEGEIIPYFAGKNLEILFVIKSFQEKDVIKKTR